MPPVNMAITRGAFNLTNILHTLPASTPSPHAFTKCSACMFSTTSSLDSVKKPVKRRANDPYRAAQAKQRKTANIARQAVLQKERQAAMGDPVRSKPTEFVQSFRNPSAYQASPARETGESSQHLNFFLKSDDLAYQLERSKWLTEPPSFSQSGSRALQEDAETIKNKQQQFADEHENAERALRNITSLPQGSSKDRTRLNVQRCIEEFGRHNTDNYLPPKPASTASSSKRTELSESEAAALAELTAIPTRVGPDTGSSEVQIAILTAKINTLADNLGKKDMHNKRNVRLLVHRRQKLLAYLRRRERGGPRWQNLVEKLGINDAMWKGEISM